MSDYRLEELCSEIFREIREDFPDMTFSQFKEIVKAPWFMLQSEMEGDEYMPVRLHYFGVFQIAPSLARKGKKVADESLRRGIIEPEEHQRIITKLNHVLKDEN